MKKNFLKIFIISLLMCSIVLASSYSFNDIAKAQHRVKDSTTIKNNVNIIVLLPTQTTSKMNVFMKSLCSTYNVNVVKESEISQYINPLKKHELVMLSLGNRKDYLRKCLSLHGIGIIKSESNKSTYHFKKIEEAFGKETIIEEGTVEPELYGIKILKNGTISEFEQASNSGPILNKALKDWIGTSAENPLSNKNSTFSNSSPTWSKIADRTKDYSYEPYGEILQTVWVYKLLNDNSTSYDWYATHTFNSTIPGTLEWNSGYQTQYSKIYHYYTYANGTLTRWGPTTTNTNSSYSVSVGVSAGDDGALVNAGLSWTGYIPDVMVYDDTIPSNKVASWDLEYIRNSAAATHTFKFEPGSNFKVPDGYSISMSPCNTAKFTKYYWWGGSNSIILELTYQYP